MEKENVETIVAGNSQKIKNLEEKMERIEDDSKSLNRLTAVLEEQVRQTTKKDEDHTEVLDRINSNLTNLNNRFDHMEVRVKTLEKKDDRFMDTKSKIIASVVAGLILAALVTLLGLKT